MLFLSSGHIFSPEFHPSVHNIGVKIALHRTDLSSAFLLYIFRRTGCAHTPECTAHGPLNSSVVYEDFQNLHDSIFLKASISLGRLP